jgi:hypothetical protein
MEQKQENSGKQPLWYVRRGENIQGPFPCGTIRRFILLGRVRMDDDVSVDRKSWKMVSLVPDVIPPGVRKAAQEGTLDELLPDQLREDERTGRERRSAKDDLQFKERRKGERRQDEPELLHKHRVAREQLQQLQEEKQTKRPYLGILFTTLLILLLIGGGLYMGAPQLIAEPDCSALPAPGVSWRNCNLDQLQAEGVDLSGALINNALLRQANLSGSNFRGSDLMYAIMSGSDLSYAEFTDAKMKGIDLRHTTLTYADMSGADLSFANFRKANVGGVNFAGAILDNAIWIDGSTCLPGSVGVCRKAGKQ